MSSEEFNSVYLVLIMAFNLTITSIMCVLGLLKYYRNGSYFHFGVTVTCSLFLINDFWYFTLYLGGQLPSVSFHYARVYIPLVSGGLLACLGIQRFRVFSKAGLAPWYPSLIRFFMIGLTLTMLVVGVGSLSYAYFTYNVPPKEQTHWTKWTCSLTMLYFLFVDLSLSIMSFFLVVKLRLHMCQISNEANDPKFKNSLRKRILFCIILLFTMIISSTTGFIVFCFSLNIISDTLTIMFVRTYIIAAVFEWHFIVRIVKM